MITVTADRAMPGEICQVGVIGAGQMGRGIAHVCALAGLDVSVVDISADALAQVHEAIGRDLLRQVTRGRITEESRANALARIITSAGYAAFADCDLVIEAAAEREDIKREIFR
jgi:3-hydroxybutyryl-CoA dehydrogenase